MVVQAKGCYRENFRRERGVTQGEPLLATTFNVLVGAVVRHWESMAEEIAGGDSSDNDDAAQPVGGDDSGRQRRKTVSGGGTCATESEGRMFLRGRWDGGLHQPGVAPDRI